MNEIQVPNRRRSGGRAGRVAARAAPLASHARPVRGGLEGGVYRPLGEADVVRLHQAALQVLEEIGLGSAPPSGVEILTAAGAVQGSDGRIRFPRALVEDMIATAGKDITLPGRDPRHDLHVGGQRVYFGTAGAAVHIVDLESGGYRETTARDLYDAARLVEQLDNVHFFQRPVVCREFTDPLTLDLNTIFACCSGTAKHIGTSFSGPGSVAPSLELLHQIAGGEAAWRARPFVSNSNCFVVPPLTFAPESCEIMEACIRGGMPVLLLSAGQAGATAPAPLAACIVQAVAECLAGVVYVNAMAPGYPAVFGTWPFVSDLRSGAMSGGSGEQALLSAGCAQMHKFYGLPGGAAAGIADAKLPDMQAGWEQAISNVMAGLSGLNLVYESVGMHASLLGFCFESLILGDDMLGQVLRCIRGIEVSEDNLNLDTMRRVCLGGEGHYLGQPQTLELMQSEYVYPTLADRRTPKEWEERGRPQLLANAIERKAKLLKQAGPPLIDPQTEMQIRARFPLLV